MRAYTHSPDHILAKILPFFVLVSLIASIFLAPLTAGAAADETAKAPEGLDCVKWSKGIQLDHCAALLGFYAFVKPASFILDAGGAVFDAMVAFSLDRNFMAPPFVTEAWEAVRDIANMAFIFVLLYIAITTILGLGEYKKLLVNLIVIALIINFSAFFTKIVIDASNIVALGFYDSISAPAGTHITGGSVTERRISAVFMKGFDLQNITGKDAFKDWKTKREGVAGLFFVFLAAGIVMIAAAFTFFMAGFLFLGRLVAFWFLIIASPLAFVAFVLPGMKSYFDKWWSNLTEQALVAPVFLFFMFVISKIVNNFIKSVFTVNAAGSFVDIAINIILLFSALLITLTMALDVTKGLSGTAGKLATKYAGGDWAEKKLKQARGAAKNFAKRETVGRATAALADSKAMKWVGRKAPTLGRFGHAGLDAAGGAEYAKTQKAREKEKVAYGARVSGETGGEKRARVRDEAELYARHRRGEIDDTELATQLGYMQRAKQMTETARREEYASATEPKGRLGKITQRITNQDTVNRETARRVRGKEKGEDTDSEKLSKIIEKLIKTTPPVPPAP